MKKRNPIHAYKRLLAEDVDWDYRCLIALEKKKLQRMHDCIKCNSCLEHKDFVVRDIAICIRLIDIFMEEDAVFKSWLHQSFSGEMKYTLTTDNGYVLKVNGEVVEEAQAGGRRGFGFGFGRKPEYKSFPVEAGKTYDVVIEYRHGNGQFALLRGDICERHLIDFTDLANQVKDADAIVIIGGISAQMEGEGGDKEDIELPKVQQKLVKAMHQTGKLVCWSGRIQGIGRGVVWRLQPWWQTACNLLSLEQRPARFPRLLDEEPHLSLLYRCASVCIRLWTQLHHFQRRRCQYLCQADEEER